MPEYPQACLAVDSRRCSNDATRDTCHVNTCNNARGMDVHVAVSTQNGRFQQRKSMEQQATQKFVIHNESSWSNHTLGNRRCHKHSPPPPLLSQCVLPREESFSCRPIHQCKAYCAPTGTTRLFLLVSFQGQRVRRLSTLFLPIRRIASKWHQKAKALLHRLQTQDNKALL